MPSLAFEDIRGSGTVKNLKEIKRHKNERMKMWEQEKDRQKERVCVIGGRREKGRECEKVR